MKRLRELLHNKPLMNTIKIVLAVALLIVVCRMVDWHEVMQLLTRMNWWWFVLAVVLQWIVIAIGNHRLQILLRAQGVHLSYLLTLKYNCIGYFFNLAFPGGTGGDVVKAFYVVRETHHKKAECVTVILLDRVMGLIAVVLIAAGALVATLKLSPTFRPLLPLVLVLLLLSLGGAALVLTKDYWKRYAWWGAVELRTPPLVRRMLNALHQYRTHKATALIALGESVVLQLIMCFVAWCFGLGLGFSMRWYLYFIIFPILTLIITIPITPSGLGITEVFSALCFTKTGEGKDAGVAFMLLLRLLMLNMALVGFVYWIMPGTHVKREELAAAGASLAAADEPAAEEQAP